MPGNSNLHVSRADKTDEFYTQLSLIESELKHYKGHFEGKVVLCNCDDPYESNFFKYFAINFNSLKLKKLIATCYVDSPIANTQISLFDDEPIEDKTTRAPHKIEITEVSDYTGDGRVGLADVEYLLRNRENTLTRLKGDGDFRSAECIELLKQSDVVVTNPPFSLFREYVAQLMEHEKFFLIIGNQNAITYREIFPLIRDNKVWLGYNNGHFWFMVPDTYEKKETDFKIDENGQKWRRMGNISFFTNLDIEKRHEDMILFREYSSGAYPKYDNYNAIEVSRAADMPCDYYGVMGVPITFMQYYNPKQFKILGSQRWGKSKELVDLYCGNKATCENDKATLINGKETYDRIFIKRIR
jgi:hypothetical protein